MERHTYIRIAKIDAQIRQKKHPNCKKLADQFETSQRTILRDIEAMKDSMGAPIGYSKERNGYYYTDDNFQLPEIRLTEGELVSIFLGEEILKKYQGTPFGSVITSAFEKIRLSLPDSISIDLNTISDSFSFNIPQTRKLDEQSAKTFDILAKAIKTKNSVEITYHALGRNTIAKRIVDPYHLRHSMGTWYLIGYCQLRKDFRTFIINQIRTIKVIDSKYKVDPTFSIEKFLAYSWDIFEGAPITKVKIKLDKEIARWFIDRKLHPTQKTTENKDGSITMEFKVSGTSEIKRWVLGQGKYAKVIEPRSLRREIIEEAKEMQK